MTEIAEKANMPETMYVSPSGTTVRITTEVYADLNCSIGFIHVTPQSGERTLTPDLKGGVLHFDTKRNREITDMVGNIYLTSPVCMQFEKKDGKLVNCYKNKNGEAVIVYEFYVEDSSTILTNILLEFL